MNKYLKWTLISIGGLIVLLVLLVLIFGKTYTKSFSPQETAIYESGNLEIAVDYSRPYKKDRVIFGELVPYGEVWRTGANEATVFTTSQDLNIGDNTLEAGTYTLFTIPNPDTWQIIWNSKAYDWGLNWDGTSPREPAYDVLAVEVQSEEMADVVEQFTIDLERATLTLSWDRTRVSIPLVK